MGFGNLAFSVFNYSRYNEFFEDTSAMILPQAGTYTGAKDIEEYVRFSDASSPYFRSQEVTVFNVSLAGVDAATGLCTFLTTSALAYEMDEEFALPAKFALVAMTKIEYEPKNNIVRNVFVFYTKPFLDLIFNNLLRSRQTSRFVCNTLASSCSSTFTLNGFDSIEDCVQKMEALDSLSPGGYLDGYDFGCRSLHAVFAAKNPLHCAHVSLIPAKDSNGNVICQKSKSLLPSDYFSDADVQVFSDFAKSQRIDSEKGFKLACENSSV